MPTAARVGDEAAIMMPGIDFTPLKPGKSSFDQLGSFDMDTKIVIFSVITIFINVYLCAAVALLTTVYVLINRDKRLQILSIPHVRWLFLFLILLFAVPPIYGNWLGLGAGVAIFVIFIYYLYLCTVMTKSLFNAVIDVTFFICIIYVLIALFQRLLGIAIRSPSTFQNANYYSFAMELIMMMSFYRLYTAKTWGHRAFIITVILFNLLAIWTTDCRSAWPSIFGGLVILFLANKRMRSLLILIGIYIVGIKLALSFPNIFPRLSTLEFKESIRVDIWLEALRDIGRHLFFGVGSLGYLFQTTGHYKHAHDLTLELLCSFGLVGTFFLLTYFGLTLYDIGKRFNKSPFRDIYALVLACIAVTVIHGIGDVTVMWPQTGMLLALVLAGGAIKSAEPETIAAA